MKNFQLRTTLLFLLILAGLAPSFAAEKPKIVVFGPKSESASGYDYANQTVVNRVSEKIRSAGRFDLLQDARISSILKENNFPEVMAGEDYDYRKLGELIGAKAVIICGVIQREQEVTRHESGDNNGYGLIYGLLFPPLLLLQGSSGRTYTEKIQTYSLSIRAIDVATGTVIAEESMDSRNIDDYFAVYQKLYLALLQNFQAKGKIIDLDAGQVFIDLGKKSGIKEKDIFEIYRPGWALDDSTAEAARIPDEKVGELEVDSVADYSAVCAVIPHLTAGPVRRGFIVRHIPLETVSVLEQARRRYKDETRPLGMADAFIGQAVGPSTLKSNPAGLGQVSETALNLGWNLHYNSAVVRQPNTGHYSGGRTLYGSNVENPAYPSDFNVVIPLEKVGVGLHVGVDDMRIAQGAFQYDNGGLNVGLYAGTALVPNVMVGLGLEYSDRWVGLYSGDNSYQFRGAGVGGNLGLLFRPTEALGIGGVLNIPGKMSGELVHSAGTSSTESFSFNDLENAGLGVSYRPFDRLVLNLDVINYLKTNVYGTRLGAEFSLTDNLAIRCGAGNRLSRIPNFADDPNYSNGYNIKTGVYSAGIGYATDTLTFDLAGEYEFLREGNVIVYPDFNAGSQVRTLLSGYKEGRIKFSLGVKF